MQATIAPFRAREESDPQAILAAWPGLRSNEWFAGLDASLQAELVRRSVVWNVKSKQVICPQGAAPEFWFGIARGAVMMVAEEDGAILDLLERGQWFGAATVLAGARSPCAFQASAASTLLVMRGTALRQLIGVRPPMVDALARLHALGIERATGRMRDLCTPALRDRLLRLLAMLARRVGEPLGDGYCRLSIRISQGELASFVRSSRQRINKLMRELVQQGDVRVRGGRIEVALRLSGSPRT